MPHSLSDFLIAAWLLYLMVLVVWIVLQKRPPVATLAWLLSLAALPYLGLVIFYVFGPQKLKRSRMRRLGSKDQVAKESNFLRQAAAALPASDRTRRLATLIQRAGGFPPSTATDLRLLIDGADTYEALFAAIRAARHHVHLEYYIYNADTVGSALRDLLVIKAREGVSVRLLVDALGSKNVTRKFTAELLAAGGQVAYFHSVGLRRLRLRPVVNMRTHRKIVVCDGRVGFVGGINITDEEDPRIRPDAYHDSHLRVEGMAVHRLQQVFLEDWHYATDETLSDPALSPDLPTGRHVMQVIASGPDTELAPIQRAMIGAIEQASDRVWLTTPYFVPDEASLFALTSAGLRGLDVRVLVPRRGDSWLVTMAARSYFDDLIRAGVKVYEYQPRMLHSKTLLVDERYSMIGTANFDNRSFRLNFEVSVILYEPELAQRFAEQFSADLRDSRPVLRDRRLPWHHALAEASARLCTPVL